MKTYLQRYLKMKAIARVLASKSRKKLIVAGPGAGKTTIFRKLLDQAERSGRCAARAHLRSRPSATPYSASTGRTRVVESGTLVISGRRVTAQRRRHAFAISVGK
jgi:hypothetical protein